MPTTPILELTQLRPDLAQGFDEFDLMASRQGFVGLRVAPVLESSVAYGKYKKTLVGHQLQERDTRRAPDGTYSRGEGKFTSGNFTTEEHGHEERVDHNEAAMLGSWLAAEMEATGRCLDVVLRSHNKRVMDAGVAVTGNAAAGVAWNLSATADPAADILAAKIAVRDRIGVAPNAMLIDWETHQHLLAVAAIKELIKYSGRDDPKPKNISLAALAAALDLEEIVVSGAVYNSANEAVTATLSSQWDKTQALLYVKNTGRSLNGRTQFMRTIHWGADGSQIGGVVEQYEDPNRRSTIIRSRMQTDEHVIFDTAAQRITGVA